MDLVTAGNTRHYIVRFDPALNPDALRVAQAILATCEADLSTLALYLPYQRDGLGDPLTDPPIDVQIIDLPTNRGGANNTGSWPGRQSIIRIGVLDKNGAPVPDEFARFLFAAEMAEVLMGFYGWDLSTSQGEALSRIMGEQLHDGANGAYYPASVSSAPWVNEWINSSPRPDWIGPNEKTDLNQISYGCGVLFINYLRNQLNIPLDVICQAGGNSLADKYHALTRKNDDPAKALGGLLDKHYSGNVTLLNNNPFPLLDEKDRKISLNFGKPSFKVSRLGAQRGTVHLAPFFSCPAKDYGYRKYEYSETQTITATAIGFGQPQFQWRVNGKALPFQSGTLQVDASLTILNANDPHTPSRTTGPFAFDYQTDNVFTQQSLSNTLTLTSASRAGSYDVVIEAAVAEGFGNFSNQTTTSQTITFDTVTILYDPPFYDDQQRCIASFEKSMHNGVRIHEYMQLIKTLPDPPSPFALQKIMRASHGLRDEIAALSQRDHATAVKVARFVAAQLGITSEFLLK